MIEDQHSALFILGMICGGCIGIAVGGFACLLIHGDVPTKREGNENETKR